MVDCHHFLIFENLVGSVVVSCDAVHLLLAVSLAIVNG